MLHRTSLEARGVVGCHAVTWPVSDHEKKRVGFQPVRSFAVVCTSALFDSLRAFFDSIVCIVATLTGDIRFQPNGSSDVFGISELGIRFVKW